MPRITKSSIKTFFINVRYENRTREYTYSCDVSDLKEGEKVFIISPDEIIVPVDVVIYVKKPKFQCKPILNRIQLALLDDYKIKNKLNRNLYPDEIKEVLDL